ncbi:hypothetical protein AJ78_08158 [Emergomyces pasteurianus Ep9510]|uniref:C3HC-type domain-containing protein n=1 Tax=Emergomyces pasteurianus Ep9510 TaxID=1447872 RepID=A0A1J9P3L4_9EURO|nr:hypothetical protein AJ78_08158 [Emergomyces pasteurianus Ep9510]
MSYTLATKKRKFHRVLDSLSGGANVQKSSNADSSTRKHDATTAASAASVKYPTIKKVRLASSSCTAGPDDMIVGKSVSNISRNSSLSPSSQHRPNFVPWDRERFLERLETFRRVDRWSPKPAPINEVQWAKRGWSCVDVMRVECVGGCGRAVVVKLPEDNLDEVTEDGDDNDKIIERREVPEERLVEEYSKRIADGHSERCPWRKSGCDDTIQRLPLTNPETAVNGLQKRYLNLTHLESKLPPVDNIDRPAELNMGQTVKILPPTFLSDSPERDDRESTENLSQQPCEKEDNQAEVSTLAIVEDINRSAFVLAMFGWDAAPEVGVGLATCGACFRRLGLWMYKPKEDGSVSVYAKLDVVGEHMEYCPWVNPGTQSGGRKPVLHSSNGKLQSGWEILGQAIKTMHRRRTRNDVPSTPAETASQEPPTIPVEAKVDDDEMRKVRDREWWAKLRRVRQSLQVKAPKKTK